MKKHSKHTNLARKDNDVFAPNEIAILGSKCDVIADLVMKVSAKLNQYKLAYFDASHAKDVTPNTLSTYTFHHEGNLQIETTSQINKYEQRLQFADYDFVFINGNHYQGSKQILILDDAKEASVLKRLEQLNDVKCIVKLNENSALFPFLLERYPELEKVKTFHISDIENIAKYIDVLIDQKKPKLKGLILTGGKSTRMGTDKSQLNYHGKPQQEHVRMLMLDYLDDVCFSVAQPSEDANKIHDTFLNLGPFGGICSAFQREPNSAWMVLATDLPFVDRKIIQKLKQHRNPSKVATAIKGKNKEFPEPLIAIYEPKAYAKLLSYLAQGYSCPRKILINSDVEIVEVDDHFIRNINTKAAFEQAKKELNS